MAAAAMKWCLVCLSRGFEIGDGVGRKKEVRKLDFAAFFCIFLFLILVSFSFLILFFFWGGGDGDFKRNA